MFFPLLFSMDQYVVFISSPISLIIVSFLLFCFKYFYFIYLYFFVATSALNSDRPWFESQLCHLLVLWLWQVTFLIQKVKADLVLKPENSPRPCWLSRFLWKHRLCSAHRIWLFWTPGNFWSKYFRNITPFHVLTKYLSQVLFYVLGIEQWTSQATALPFRSLHSRCGMSDNTQ